MQPHYKAYLLKKSCSSSMCDKQKLITCTVVSCYLRPPLLWFQLLAINRSSTQEMKNSRNKWVGGFQLHVILSSVIKSLETCFILPGTWIIPLSSVSTLQMLPTHWSLSSHLGHQINCHCILVLVFKSPSLYSILAPKHKGHDAGNSEMQRKAV